MVIAAFLLFSAGAIVLISRPFFAAFKLIAEVLLWLGDPLYRKRLRLALSSAIRDIAREDEDLLLIGHSLGTVLLVDVLIAEVIRGRHFATNRIRLVTFGSPLKRLMSKCFLEIFPKPSVIVDALIEAHSDFCWINAYRPWDFVSRDLDLKAKPQSTDLSTMQGLQCRCLRFTCRLATTRAKLAVRMESLPPFLQDSFIPYFMPVYPGAPQRSTGPRTIAGKNQSRLNAYRHGLTSQVVVLPVDSTLVSFARRPGKDRNEKHLAAWLKEQQVSEVVMRHARKRGVDGAILAASLVWVGSAF